jgi:hypothetical protein
MSGPYPPEYGAGPAGRQMYPATGPQWFPQQSTPEPYPDTASSTYPGMLPPPVQYPKKRRWPLIAGALLAVLVVAATVTAIVFATRGGDASGSGGLTDASAKAAIQEYLDAMTNGDDETVARHTLCGMFDAVREKRSDLALAGLASDAFRQQYGQAEVTSIDKIVTWSPHQAQVLFTMEAKPTGSRRGQPRTEGEQQGVAQLLTQGDEVLVCSYLPRTAGQY